MSLTLNDLKTLEVVPDLEETVQLLENASKGWFQEEDDFEIMRMAEEKAAIAKASKAKPVQAKKKTTTNQNKYQASSSMNSWNTIGMKKTSRTQATAAAKKSTSGFAAAFGDDSD